MNSLTDELDYEGAAGETPFTYDGRGGIELGGLFRRAVFAWRFRDANLLISGQVQAESRILINRSIVERAAQPLPFLTFDADPYLAVTNEGYVWIWDAYTTSDGYPYSQSLDMAEATAGLLGPQEVNYLRNSVKAVVDAYDGSVTYYADLSEPIMQVWDRAFPASSRRSMRRPTSSRATSGIRRTSSRRRLSTSRTTTCRTPRGSTGSRISGRSPPTRRSSRQAP